MLEAIELCEDITGNKLNYTYVDESRRGDHIWWISDLSRFKTDYPNWSLRYDVPKILQGGFPRHECLLANGLHG